MVTIMLIIENSTRNLLRYLEDFTLSVIILNGSEFSEKI